MNDAELTAFIDMSMAELNAKQQNLEQSYRLMSWARWQLDPDTCRLRWENEQGQNIVDADAVFVGSYSTRVGTWTWGSSNFHLTREDRAKSENIRELATVTRCEIFEYGRQVEVDEYTAFELTAMAVHYLKADGFFSSSEPRSQDLIFHGPDEYSSPSHRSMGATLTG